MVPKYKRDIDGKISRYSHSVYDCLCFICDFVRISSASGRVEDRNLGSTGTSETYAWEEASLWICPLH